MIQTDLQDMVELYDLGERAVDLAEHYGYHRVSIHRFINEYKEISYDDYDGRKNGYEQ